MIADGFLASYDVLSICRIKEGDQHVAMAERKIRVTAAVTKEESLYVARCLEVEVTSQGETVEAALGNLREALELYFEDDGANDPLELLAPPIIAPLDIEIRS